MKLKQISLVVYLGLLLSSCSTEPLEKVDEFRSQSSYTVESLHYRSSNVWLSNGEEYKLVLGDSIQLNAGNIRMYDTSLLFNKVNYEGQAIEINAFHTSNPNNEKIKVLLFENKDNQRLYNGIFWLRSEKGQGEDMYLSFREIDGVKTLFVSIARDGNTGDPKAQIIAKLN